MDTCKELTLDYAEGFHLNTHLEKPVRTVRDLIAYLRLFPGDMPVASFGNLDNDGPLTVMPLTMAQVAVSKSDHSVVVLSFVDPFEVD